VENLLYSKCVFSYKLLSMAHVDRPTLRTVCLEQEEVEFCLLNLGKIALEV
jgi:hypothetical protein